MDFKEENGTFRHTLFRIRLPCTRAFNKLQDLAQSWLKHAGTFIEFYALSSMLCVLNMFQLERYMSIGALYLYFNWN